METKKNNLVMQNCPSWHSCNSPICPLDINQNERIRYSDEPLCRATKRIRLQIGLKYRLPLIGLTKKEYSGILLSYGSLEAYTKAKLGKVLRFAPKGKKELVQDSSLVCSDKLNSNQRRDYDEARRRKETSWETNLS